MPLRHRDSRIRDPLREGMLRLKIVQAGDPALRQSAREETQRLIRDMQETMSDAPGVGLAAPQVGLSLQLAVIEDREDLLKTLPAQDLLEKERNPVPFHVLINPRIVQMTKDKRDFFEGCLSLPGFSAMVPRAHTVRVEFLNERAEARQVEATGWYARILQHEIDHLGGTLYLDRMHTRTFTSLENWNRYWKGKPISKD
jgi:peptide deformylase